MKKKKLSTVLAICTAILFGCGSAEPSANAVTPTPSEAANPFDQDYFISQIEEFPVNVVTIFIYKNSNSSHDLYMTDCTITNMDTTFITAQGILTDGYNSSEDPVTVQYELSYADDGSSCTIVNAIAPSKAIQLTPAEPFSLDLLYDYINSINIKDRSTGTDSTIDEFTLELDTYWENNYNYNNSIYVIDSAGNRYRTFTTIEINYHHNLNDDTYSWKISGNSDLYIYN